jgi:hypothetical protein
MRVIGDGKDRERERRRETDIERSTGRDIYKEEDRQTDRHTHTKHTH